MQFANEIFLIYSPAITIFLFSIVDHVSLFSRSMKLRFQDLVEKTGFWHLPRVTAPLMKMYDFRKSWYYITQALFVCSTFSMLTYIKIWAWERLTEALHLYSIDFSELFS